MRTQVDPTAKAVSVVAIVQGEHKYVILYTEEHAAEAIKQCSRWAFNRELSFSWDDAFVMGARIWQESQAVKGAT